MHMALKVFLIGIGCIALVLLLFGAVQRALHDWFGVDVSLVPDIWQALNKIPSAIGYAFWQVIGAIGNFLAAPFNAFAYTLYQFGLPLQFAQGLAIAIIIAFIALVAYGIAKWRGWL